MTLMATETHQSNKQDVVIKKPNMYKVIFNNDDTTPAEFVKDLLKHIFHHDDDNAAKITLEIHNNGRGVAGVYTYEVAEQKHTEAVYISRNNGHQLNINLESE
jgi:ATP-dependent Clp protease adaptor protein ClpS